MKPKNMHLQLYIESIVQLLGNNPNYPSIGKTLIHKKVFVMLTFFVVALKNFIVMEMIPQKGMIFNVKMLVTILKALPGSVIHCWTFVF